MVLTLVSESTTEPVTVAELKTYLRMESTDSTAEDGLLGSYITVARKQAEHLTRRSLVAATWQIRFDDFLNSTQIIELPKPPISTASTNVTVTYIEDTTAGNSTTVGSTVYTVDFYSEPGRIYPAYDNEWPDSIRDQKNAITVQFVSGYSTTNIPQPIVQWIKMRALDMFENRESITEAKLEEIPRTYVDGLLDEYTLPLIV